MTPSSASNGLQDPVRAACEALSQDVRDASEAISQDFRDASEAISQDFRDASDAMVDRLGAVISHELKVQTRIILLAFAGISFIYCPAVLLVAAKFL